MIKRIAVIGAGAMGSTLVQAIVGVGLKYQILVCDRDPDKLRKIANARLKVKTTANLALCADADIVFLAIKPQDFQSIPLNLKKNALLCSVMAGVSIATLRRRLGAKKVVRMMPNMAASVGAGFTAWTSVGPVIREEKNIIETILSRMGQHLFMSREDNIDKATAISGSGPAYFFTMILACVGVARKLGFAPEVATKMAVQTIKGASALINEKSNLDELIRRVASKGGTTEAALTIFKNAKINKIWEKAIRAAYKRAKELSKEK